ncbi:hypothetical protein LTR78_010132 [Recurvomyces mirabilis]|uniref:Uncharacterized protein n=1 Tax=Recurvomyces mirabilis TaxID=574656 RepID=A0AAE0TM37_9PEZI|nr:hypothetical protein LTR78_010132 [Recurvomyces mirabilis]KAK5149923.1 hypothetical protein LTS14_010528 [Recurvomyces mirabilis]
MWAPIAYYKCPSSTQWLIDQVGLNGFISRVTLLTYPDLVRDKCHESSGKVKWVGVTCNTTYELTDGGPFVHRRVIFKSTIPWPASPIYRTAANPSSGLGVGDYARSCAAPLAPDALVGCLRRLFAQDTVRGLIQGPTSNFAITVLSDEKYQCTGVDNGKRLTKKFWNGFEKEPAMQYAIGTNGSLTAQLANSPTSQHIYLVDIFSYGLEGLDASLPLLKSDGSGGEEPPMKRTKSESSTEIDMDEGWDKVSKSLPSTSGHILLGSRDERQVSITNEMKLYFRNV